MQSLAADARPRTQPGIARSPVSALSASRELRAKRGFERRDHARIVANAQHDQPAGLVEMRRGHPRHHRRADRAAAG